MPSVPRFLSSEDSARDARPARPPGSEPEGRAVGVELDPLVMTNIDIIDIIHGNHRKTIGKP